MHDEVAPDRPDSRALMAEIERDVRERRRTGDLDPDFERELDVVFAEVAPPGAFGGGFDTVVDQAARHAVVDYDVPIAGRRPLRMVKRAVKLLTAWYMIYVGRQLVAFASTTLRALRILGGRVDALEARSPATDPRVAATFAPVGDDLDATPFAGAVTQALQASAVRGGRVLHADCGDGALLVALKGAGIDVYGVDPRSDAAARADALGIEVRREGALDHLRSVPAGALAAVVLSGCVDRLTLGDQIELLDLASSALVSGGVLALIGRDPGAWSRAMAPVASDLAAGRPLHSSTWAHLLSSRPFTGVRVHDAPVSVPDAVAASDDPAVRALAAAVFPPPAFAVIALRR